MKVVHLIIILVILSAAFTASCWNDDCDQPCRDSYSCYYGICLSRGYCPTGGNHTEQNCLRRDATTNECLEPSPYDVCEEGYSCECTTLDAN